MTSPGRWLFSGWPIVCRMELSSYGWAPLFYIFLQIRRGRKLEVTHKLRVTPGSSRSKTKFGTRPITHHFPLFIYPVTSVNTLECKIKLTQHRACYLHGCQKNLLLYSGTWSYYLYQISCYDLWSMSYGATQDFHLLSLHEYLSKVSVDKHPFLNPPKRMLSIFRIHGFSDECLIMSSPSLTLQWPLIVDPDTALPLHPNLTLTPWCFSRVETWSSVPMSFCTVLSNRMAIFSADLLQKSRDTGIPVGSLKEFSVHHCLFIILGRHVEILLSGHTKHLF